MSVILFFILLHGLVWSFLQVWLNLNLYENMSIITNATYFSVFKKQFIVFSNLRFFYKYFFFHFYVKIVDLHVSTITDTNYLYTYMY